MSLCIYTYTEHHHNIQSNKNMFITSENSLVSACVLRTLGTMLCAQQKFQGLCK